MRITAQIDDDDHKFGIDNVVVKVENDTEEETPADTTPPVITVPDDISGTPRVVSLGYYAEFTVTATDDTDDTVDVTCSHSSGYFQVGTTTVTCSATDDAGNTANASFTITVTSSAPTDSDGDGFHDGIDQCPNESSSSNYGCPEIEPEDIISIYGGNRLKHHQSNSTGTYPYHSTITLGAISNGTSGIVVSGHALQEKVNKTHSHYSILDTFRNETSIIASQQIPHIQGSVDVGFIPISQSNVTIHHNTVQYQNNTIQNVTHGILESVDRYQPLKIFGIKSNGEGLLLYKNATTFDGGIVLTNMGIALYPSRGGDSGSPIIYGNSTDAEIVGVHRGGACIFESLSENRTQINLWPYPNLCTRDNFYFKVFSAWENVKNELNLQ